MNTNTIFKSVQRLEVLMFTFLFSILSFAQDAEPETKLKVETTKTTTSTEEWVSNPVFWVIGAALFIILIAVIMRGGRKD